MITVRIDYHTTDNHHSGSETIKWHQDHIPVKGDEILISGITKQIKHLSHDWTVTKRTWENNTYCVLDVVGVNPNY